jgi:hypothetical protein
MKYIRTVYRIAGRFVHRISATDIDEYPFAFGLRGPNVPVYIFRYMHRLVIIYAMFVKSEVPNDTVPMDSGPIHSQERKSWYMNNNTITN